MNTHTWSSCACLLATLWMYGNARCYDGLDPGKVEVALSMRSGPKVGRWAKIRRVHVPRIQDTDCPLEVSV